MDRFLLRKFPRTSQSSHIFLLEYSDEFLGCGVYLRVTVVTLLDTNIRLHEVIPGCRQGRNYCNLELDFGDPEVDVVDQVKVLPVFLEGHNTMEPTTDRNYWSDNGSNRRKYLVKLRKVPGLPGFFRSNQEFHTQE